MVTELDSRSNDKRVVHPFVPVGETISLKLFYIEHQVAADLASHPMTAATRARFDYVDTIPRQSFIQSFPGFHWRGTPSSRAICFVSF